jgi:5-methyltetrahydropteroyltriglutamate--homocysteine methyltransferase
MNLLADCERAAGEAGGPFKFTVTSPYMLARTLVDAHYGRLEAAAMAIAETLAEQAAGLPCACLQVDEAHLPGRPEDAELAAQAINVVLDRAGCERAAHLCFGNYGGQVIQRGTWKRLTGFLNALHADHVALEMARRPEEELEALAEVDPRIKLGIGVVDVKTTAIETADEVARRIERAEKVLGEGRVKWVHPDCGLWMLKRSVADGKIAAVGAGRERYLGAG